MIGEAIHFELELFCDTDGFMHPITHWLDDNGDDCNPDDAVAAVAGSEGRWFSLILKDFR